MIFSVTAQQSTIRDRVITSDLYLSCYVHTRRSITGLRGIFQVFVFRCSLVSGKTKICTSHKWKSNFMIHDTKWKASVNCLKEKRRLNPINFNPISKIPSFHYSILYACSYMHTSVLVTIRFSALYRSSKHHMVVPETGYDEPGKRLQSDLDTVMIRDAPIPIPVSGIRPILCS